MDRANQHLALFLSGLAGGGAQRRMLLLAAGFAARGHPVDVVVARGEGPYRAALPPSARLFALDSRVARLPGIRTRRGLWVLATTRALAAYLARERPDVLLSTSNPANLAALAARALSHSPARVVVSVNLNLSAATGPRQRFWGPALRALACRAYRRADAVIAISQGVAEDLARVLAPPRPPIVAITNPLPIAEIEEKARAPLAHPWLESRATPILLAVGKLKQQKDYPTLIRAFARVRARRPARLLILGEGEERRQLERLVRELGLAQDVALPGFAENPWAWMARASVLALSSAWEGFSNVVAEALACGCPVVSTDCPSGPAEILDHGAYGMLVPVGDDRALAEALLETLEKPRNPERLRAHARTFSVDTAVDRYLDVLVGARAAGSA
jgi:glycosyltransferase involved in cell wall biosynthesis